MEAIWPIIQLASRPTTHLRGATTHTTTGIRRIIHPTIIPDGLIALLITLTNIIVMA